MTPNTTSASRHRPDRHGAWLTCVQADHGDDPAIALHTGLGTCEDVRHFDIPMPPPAP